MSHSPYEDKCNAERGVVAVIRNKWVNVGISGVPWVGGPIQAYLAGVVADLDRAKWEAYWKDIESKLENIDAKKIDASYFSSDDFALRLRRIYQEITSGADDTKTAYLRDYLISCSAKNADVATRDLFFSHLRDITGTHILVLRHYFDVQKGLSYQDRFELPQRTDRSPITIEHLAAAIGQADQRLCEMLVADLCARGLLAPWLGQPSEPKAWSITDSAVALLNFLLAAHSTSKPMG